MVLYEEIRDGERLFAIIVRKDYSSNGVDFFTPSSLSQQLAQMSHAAGKIIKPHFHNSIPRTISSTLEVLIIKKGKLRVDLYTEAKEKFASNILCPGDVILLLDGGHGFEVLEDLEMLEVKQGPYPGDQEKTVFEGIVNP